MTSEQAWAAFRTWVVSQIPGIPVIQASQNAPAPAKPYIAISRMSIATGADIVKGYVPSTGISESIRNEYLGSCYVYAVCEPGEEYPGDLLNRLFSLRATTANLKVLSAAGICIRNVRGPDDVPRLDASSFINEAVCRVQISFSDTLSTSVTNINTEIVSQILPD